MPAFSFELIGQAFLILRSHTAWEGDGDAPIAGRTKHDICVVLRRVCLVLKHPAEVSAHNIHVEFILQRS